MDEIPKLEIEDLVATIDRWLDRHWERFVHEDDTLTKTSDLVDKINKTIGRQPKPRVETSRYQRSSRRSPISTGEAYRSSYVTWYKKSPVAASTKATVSQSEAAASTGGES